MTTMALELAMLRFLTVLLFSLICNFAHADANDENTKWERGMPWPASWGEITLGKALWNTVYPGFINKIYSPGEATHTALKEIPYAMQEGASVEVCDGKKGIFKFSSFCYDAIVDPEILGTLKKGDIVQYFNPRHGVRFYSEGPGMSPETTFRVFHKIGDEAEDQCWTGNFYLNRPRTDACHVQRADKAKIERILTRDFGPREGGGTAQ